MKRIKEKLAASRGFTLAETLICMLILLIVTGIVAAALPTASNVYTGAVDAANAQVLESTAVTVLRDELSTAKNILISPADADQTVIMYRTAETGRWNKIVSNHTTTDEGDPLNEIVIYEYGTATNVGATYETYDAALAASISYEVEDGRPLVSNKAATSNLSISFGGATYDKTTGLITITDLQVYRKGNANPVAERDTLTIKTIA